MSPSSTVHCILYTLNIVTIVSCALNATILNTFQCTQLGLYFQLQILYCVLNILKIYLFTVLQCIVHCIQYTVYSILYKVYNIQCIVYSIQSTLYSLHCTEYSVQHSVNAVQCSLLRISRQASRELLCKRLFDQCDWPLCQLYCVKCSLLALLW